MTVTMLEVSDAELIATLVHDAEVLQLGCREGFDTATLARVAKRVVSIGQHEGIEYAGFRSAVDMWVVIQRFYAVADHTLFLPGHPAKLLATFTPGQFDAVVIDCAAIPTLIDVPMVELVTAVTGKVIVLPSTYGSWTIWQGTMSGAGYRCEQAGRVWVFDKMPADVPTDTKEGS